MTVRAADDGTPAERRALQIHIAKVYLREARARRGTAFGTVLLAWAANARRRAAAIDANPAPAQGEMFG